MTNSVHERNLYNTTISGMYRLITSMFKSKWLFAYIGNLTWTFPMMGVSSSPNFNFTADLYIVSHPGYDMLYAIACRRPQTERWAPVSRQKPRNLSLSYLWELPLSKEWLLSSLDRNASRNSVVGEVMILISYWPIWLSGIGVYLLSRQACSIALNLNVLLRLINGSVSPSIAFYSSVSLQYWLSNNAATINSFASIWSSHTYCRLLIFILAILSNLRNSFHRVIFFAIRVTSIGRLKVITEHPFLPYLKQPKEFEFDDLLFLITFLKLLHLLWLGELSFSDVWRILCSRNMFPMRSLRSLSWGFRRGKSLNTDTPL